MLNIANYIPFISATVQGKPTPMITRIVEMCVGAAVTILLGYIFMVPTLSKDISKNSEIISYKLDSLVQNQLELKQGQASISKTISEVDTRERLNNAKHDAEIGALNREVFGGRMSYELGGKK